MQSRVEFSKLLLASFVSQSGSHFLTISLAAFVLLTSGSIVQSALVFVLSYVPSVFVSHRLGNWIDENLSRRLLAQNELLSILVSAACGLAIYFKVPLPILCLIIAIRSLLLFIARTGGSKWIKEISPAELQGVRIKFFFLGFFLSTAVAGILAGTILTYSSILMVVAIDIATYFLSFLLILTLKDLGQTPRPKPLSASNLVESVSQIMRNPLVRSHFLAVCLSQALFQGAYSVLVTFLPIGHFRLGAAGIGFFQLAASFGITAGFLVVWLMPGCLSGQKSSRFFRFLMVVTVGVVSLFGCTLVSTVQASLLLFLTFNLSYECIWLFHSAEFFKKSPVESIARFQFTLTSVASLVMAIFTLGYSSVLGFAGPLVAIPLVSGLALCLWFLGARTSGKETVQEPELLAGGVR